MKFWPDEEDRDPRWVPTQIVFAIVILFLLSPMYTGHMEMDWRVPVLMFAMWGVFALLSIRKPQFMKDREARWRAEFQAKIQETIASRETERLSNNQGDGI